MLGRLGVCWQIKSIKCKQVELGDQLGVSRTIYVNLDKLDKSASQWNPSYESGKWKTFRYRVFTMGHQKIFKAKQSFCGRSKEVSIECSSNDISNNGTHSLILVLFVVFSQCFTHSFIVFSHFFTHSIAGSILCKRILLQVVVDIGTMGYLTYNWKACWTGADLFISGNYLSF